MIVPVPRAVKAWFTEPCRGSRGCTQAACPSAGWPSAPSRFTLTGTEGGRTATVVSAVNGCGSLFVEALPDLSEQ